MCVAARNKNCIRITVMVLIVPQHRPNNFAMTHDAIWKPDGVHKKLSGFITAIEFIRAAIEVHSDQRFDDIRYVINDLSGVTGHELTTDSLADLAVIHCGFRYINPNCRIVFVTTDENLAKIIINTLMSPRLASCPVEVMATISEARVWLGSQPHLQHTRKVTRLRY